MACPNCDGLSAFWCPACSLPLPSKPSVCEVCHDPTCPCGKVVMRTDAELIDALRACRWILAQKLDRLAAEGRELAIKARDDRAAAREADRWIPVGERLPDSDREVLTGWTHEGEWRFDVCIFADVFLFWSDVVDGYDYGQTTTVPVTHWREIAPQPEASNG